MYRIFKTLSKVVSYLTYQNSKLRKIFRFAVIEI